MQLFYLQTHQLYYNKFDAINSMKKWRRILIKCGMNWKHSRVWMPHLYWFFLLNFQFSSRNDIRNFTFTAFMTLQTQRNEIPSYRSTQKLHPNDTCRSKSGVFPPKPTHTYYVSLLHVESLSFFPLFFALTFFVSFPLYNGLVQDCRKKSSRSWSWFANMCSV